MTKFDLKVKSAFMLDGKMRTPGSTVSASESVTRDLLRRGKVELAAGQDEPESGDPVDGGASRKGGRKKSGNQGKGADDGAAAADEAES